MVRVLSDAVHETQFGMKRKETSVTVGCQNAKVRPIIISVEQACNVCDCLGAEIRHFLYK